MTTECSKIDELLMDFIYQELEPAAAAEVKGHVDGCARCGAELAALTRTRQAMRSIADVEPPAGVSALLLHEAAKRKPASSAAAGAGGFWGAITRFFAPIQAHPAMAAVASIVLVAGVAGYLSKRGHVSSKAPAITSADSDDSLKLREKDGVEVRLDQAPTATPSAPAAAAPAEGAGGELADQAGPKGGGEKQDSTRGGIAGDDARERWGSLASKEEQKALEPAKKKSKTAELDAFDDVVAGTSGADAKDRGQYGAYATPPEGKIANAPKPAAEPSQGYRALDQENSVPPARPRISQGDDAWSREESEAAGSMALGETSQTKGGGGRSTAAKPMTPAAPPPAAASPSASTLTPNAAPGALAPQQQTSKSPAKTQATPSVPQLHAEAAKKAKSGSCTEALSIRARLYKIDPAYYAKAVRPDRAFDGCLTAEKRRSSKPAPFDKSADEAGPSQTDQKSVKQSMD